MINPRGAAFTAALIIIACGVIGGIVIGVPWPAVAVFAVVALFLAYKLVTRKRAQAPESQSLERPQG